MEAKSKKPRFGFWFRRRAQRRATAVAKYHGQHSQGLMDMKIAWEEDAPTLLDELSQYREAGIPQMKEILITPNGVKVSLNSEWQSAAPLENLDQLAKLPETAGLVKEHQRVSEEYGPLAMKRDDAEARVEAEKEKLHDKVENGLMAQATLTRRPLPQVPPELPSLWPVILCSLALAILIGIAGYQFALPYMDLVGINRANLASEWQNDPAGLLTAFGFGAAVAVVLVVIAHVGISITRKLFIRRECNGFWYRDLAAAILTVGLTIGLCIGISVLRHLACVGGTEIHALDNSEQDGVSSWIFFCIALGEALGSAILSHCAASRLYLCKKARKKMRNWKKGLRKEWQKLEPDRQQRDQCNELIYAAEDDAGKISARVSSLAQRMREIENQLCSIYSRWICENDAFTSFAVAALAIHRSCLMKAIEHQNRKRKLPKANQILPSETSVNGTPKGPVPVFQPQSPGN